MTVYFKELISILKTFRELAIARFKLDKPVFLEKVFLLYKRSNLASFLSFVCNRTVTKFSCVLLVNKVQFVFRELRSSRTFTKLNRNRLKAQILVTKLVPELQYRDRESTACLNAYRHICILLCCLAWRYFQDEAASKSRNHTELFFILVEWSDVEGSRFLVCGS